MPASAGPSGRAGLKPGRAFVERDVAAATAPTAEPVGSFGEGVARHVPNHFPSCRSLQGEGHREHPYDRHHRIRDRRHRCGDPARLIAVRGPGESSLGRAPACQPHSRLFRAARRPRRGPPPSLPARLSRPDRGSGRGWLESDARLRPGEPAGQRHGSEHLGSASSRDGERGVPVERRRAAVGRRGDGPAWWPTRFRVRRALPGQRVVEHAAERVDVRAAHRPPPPRTARAP